MEVNRSTFIRKSVSKTVQTRTASSEIVLVQHEKSISLYRNGAKEIEVVATNIDTLFNALLDLLPDDYVQFAQCSDMPAVGRKAPNLAMWVNSLLHYAPEIAPYIVSLRF